jgi:hypothetical protein
VKFESSSQLFADCVASIDTRRLRRIGLFDRSPNASVVSCQVVSAEMPELQVELSWDGAAGQVDISIPGAGAAGRQTVAVGRRERALGGGYYFLCPISGDRCEKLYYSEGRWGGRKAKRLSYSSQNGSLSDRCSYTLLRLTAQLEGAEGQPLPSPERRARIETRIAHVQRKLAAAPRRRASRIYPDPRNYADLMHLPGVAPQGADLTMLIDRSLATEKALERAASFAIGNDDTIQWLFRRGEQLKALTGAAPAPRGAADLAPDFIENYPRVDLRVLAQRGLLKAGARRGAQLDWSGLDCEIDRCNLLLDLRDEALWFAGFEIYRDGEVSYQAMRIVPAAGGGAQFVCPLSGAAVETVAYRAGCFASAQPLRMTRRAGRA